MSIKGTKLTIGRLVKLDADLRSNSIVRVVRQTPNRLFTTVESNGHQWDVMTRRLTLLDTKE
jgi:hypothetical protein